MGRLEDQLEGGFVKESSTLAGPQQPAKRGHVERAALHCNCGLWGEGGEGWVQTSGAGSLGDKEQGTEV